MTPRIAESVNKGVQILVVGVLKPNHRLADADIGKALQELHCRDANRNKAEIFRRQAGAPQ